MVAIRYEAKSQLADSTGQIDRIKKKASIRNCYNV